MLLKKNRADKKTIEKIFKQGKFINSPSLSFKFLFSKASNSLDSRQISFIAPKSVAKTDVKRNLLRRRGYAALKKNLRDFPAGIVGAFVFKVSNITTLELEQEIRIVLNKLK